MTGHGPASITVTGMCVPAASKTRVIPSLRPISPFMALLDLDLYIHPSGQIEFCEGVDGLRPRVENVDQPLVRLELELLAALLVDVRAAEHGPELPLGRQRDRAGNLRARLLGSADDIGRRLIDQGVVESFEPDADLACHKFLVTSGFSSPHRRRLSGRLLGSQTAAALPSRSA